MSLKSIFEELASRIPENDSGVGWEPKPYCLTHSQDEPCSQCEENKARGYSVKQLAGRCADGFQRGHVFRWHAVNAGDYIAVCGATYGRRSAGWSSYEKIGQVVTCPRCLKKLQAQILNEATP